jgi:hypothetical protein
MVKQITDERLRQQAAQALSERLGPVGALRFLSLVSREAFDNQQWRNEFSQYSLGELLQEVRQHRGKNS